MIPGAQTNRRGSLSEWRNQIRQEVVQEVLSEYIENPVSLEPFKKQARVDKGGFMAKWRKYFGVFYWHNMHEAVLDGDCASIAYQMKREIKKDRKFQRKSGGMERHRGRNEKEGFVSAASERSDAYDNQGRTPLSLAVKEERGDVVEELLLFHANVNKAEDIDNFPKTLTGASALMHAIQSNQSGVAARLVEHNAEVNHKNQFGMTALMLVALKNDIDLIDVLVENGADLDTKDKYGCTALHYGAMAGSLQATARLLDAGASKKKKDKKGFTARDWALFMRRQNMQAQKEAIQNSKSKMITLSSMQNTSITDDNLSVLSKSSAVSRSTAASSFLGPSFVSVDSFSTKPAPPRRPILILYKSPEIYGQIEALIESHEYLLKPGPRRNIIK